MTKMPLVAAVAACFFLVAPARAQERKPSPKHVKNKLICHDCHGDENPSKAAVPDESCYQCHGDFPAMAAYTAKLPVNPHALPKKAGHPGPFACTECHRQHQPPVVKCLECHPDFKLTPR